MMCLFKRLGGWLSPWFRDERRGVKAACKKRRLLLSLEALESRIVPALTTPVAGSVFANSVGVNSRFGAPLWNGQYADPGLANLMQQELVSLGITHIRDMTLGNTSLLSSMGTDYGIKMLISTGNFIGNNPTQAAVQSEADSDFNTYANACLNSMIEAVEGLNEPDSFGYFTRFNADSTGGNTLTNVPSYATAALQVNQTISWNWGSPGQGWATVASIGAGTITLSSAVPAGIGILFKGTDWPAVIWYQQEMFQDVHQVGGNLNVPVWASPLSYGGSNFIPYAPQGIETNNAQIEYNLGMANYADDASGHGYPQVGAASFPEANAPLAAFQTAVPNKPLYVTETNAGYSSTPLIQGNYVLRDLLNFYQLGVQRSYVFQLLLNTSESWSGLVSATEIDPTHDQWSGSFTPEGQVIYNLIGRGHGLLDFTGSDTTTPLDFTLSGDQTNLRSQLFQNSDGTYELALWRAIDLTTNPTPTNVTVTINNAQVTSATSYTDFQNASLTAADLAVSSNQLTVPVGGEVVFVKMTALTSRWGVPFGWSDADIGGPGRPGYAAFNPDTGTWTVAGGGVDIWNTSDQFHFVSQSSTGDGNLTAHVASVQNTDPWAKAGLMFRDSADPGAAGGSNAVQSLEQTISLPAGQFSTLTFLDTGVLLA